MKIVEDYIKGLKQAYYNNNGKKEWDEFEQVIHGVSEEDKEKLKEEYPDIPESLISLLEYVDGTYWREYKGEEIIFYFLGSDVCEYPYYLLSAKQILDTKNEPVDYYSDYVDRVYGDEVEMDDRITESSEEMKWLHFSDCMNNGGTSQLFIDFNPSDSGVKGQILRYLHDPDEIIVIADSFDDYLQMLIDEEYDFIQDEEDYDDEDDDEDEEDDENNDNHKE